MRSLSLQNLEFTPTMWPILQLLGDLHVGLLRIHIRRPLYPRALLLSRAQPQRARNTRHSICDR